MPRTITTPMLSALYAQEVDEAFQVLLTISHPDIPVPIRVVNDGVDLVDRIDTFNRLSTATYRAADGEIALAEIDELRPLINSDLVQSGSLIESEATNILKWASDQDNVAWVKDNVIISINATTSPDGLTGADAVVGPDGLTGADKISGIVTTVGRAIGHHIEGVIRGTGRTNYTASIFVKKGTLNHVELAFADDRSDATCSVVVNLTTGTTTAGLGDFGTPDNVVVEPYLNGWFRISVTEFTTTGAFYAAIRLYLSDGATFNPGFTPADYVYIWGAQIEIHTVLTSYIPTTTAAVTRAADIAIKHTYLAFPFDIVLADDQEGAPGRARLIIDNVNETIVNTLRSIHSAPLVDIVIVRSGWPDLTEVQLPTYTLRNIKVNLTTIEGDLVLSDLTSEPYPADNFTPAFFPGLFS